MSTPAPRRPRRGAILRVCVSPGKTVIPNCRARGSEELLRTLKNLVDLEGLPIVIEESVCISQCEHGPNVRILGGEIFNGVEKKDLRRIVDMALATARA